MKYEWSKYCNINEREKKTKHNKREEEQREHKVQMKTKQNKTTEQRRTEQQGTVSWHDDEERKKNREKEQGSSR